MYTARDSTSARRWCRVSCSRIVFRVGFLFLSDLFTHFHYMGRVNLQAYGSQQTWFGEAYIHSRVYVFLLATATVDLLLYFFSRRAIKTHMEKSHHPYDIEFTEVLSRFFSLLVLAVWIHDLASYRQARGTASFNKDANTTIRAQDQRKKQAPNSCILFWRYPMGQSSI